MNNEPKIEFFTEEQIKNKKTNAVVKKSTPWILFFVAFAFFISISVTSIVSVNKCISNAKNPSSIYENIDTRFDNNIMIGGTQNLLLKSCIQVNPFAKNALNILAVSVNFIGVFFITLLYFVLFGKYEKSLGFGKSVILAFFLSITSLMALSFGFLGSVIASIIGVWVAMKVLGTDLFGALIFITLVRFFNWLAMTMIAGLLKVVF